MENLNENTDQTNDENQNSAVESGVLGRPEKSSNFGGQEKSVYYYWQSGVEKPTNNNLKNQNEIDLNESTENESEKMQENFLEDLQENVLEKLNENTAETMQGNKPDFPENEAKNDG